MNKLFIVLLIISVNATPFEDCLRENCQTLQNQCQGAEVFHAVFQTCKEGCQDFLCEDNGELACVLHAYEASQDGCDQDCILKVTQLYECANSHCLK